MIGICRGSQIVNIYLGGPLNQEVKHHLGKYHQLALDTTDQNYPSQVMRSIIGDATIQGISLHHQAAKKIGGGRKWY